MTDYPPKNLPLAIFAADSEGRLCYRLPLVTYTNLFQTETETVWMSPQVEALTGYAPAEWVRRAGFFDSILHPDDRDPVLEEMRASRSELRPFSRDYRLIARSGGTVWVHDESVPVLDRHGEPEFIQGYFVDLTERKALEERLLHAEKTEALGRMAAGIAHDFNNHLTVIAGYAAMLRVDLSRDGKVFNDLEEILRATERARELTKQLSSFARHEQIQPQPTDLPRVIRDLGLMLSQVAGDAVELVFELLASPLVYTDRSQLEQAIVNLIANARDAMPAGGGKVTVRCETAFVTAGRESTHLDIDPGCYVQIVVADTGFGMEPHVLKRIFDPFFTTKERHAGTGLGLSSVLGIVRQGGGAIDVTSEPGVGTTFRILLPVMCNGAAPESN
jgi:two-component system, cell cycle sensor histidine kinase and response regulator CckA